MNKWSKYKNWVDWKTDPRENCIVNGHYQDISHYYWNLYYPEDSIEYKDGNVIHHKDEKHWNNAINNLQKMTHSEHLSLHHKNKFLSEETKRKMSEVRKSKPFSEEWKRNISTALKNKKKSEEHKRKLSKTRKKLGLFKGNKNPKAKTIMAEYQIFSTIKKASEIFGLDRTTISSRLKSQKPGYMYI